MNHYKYKSWSWVLVGLLLSVLLPAPALWAQEVDETPRRGGEAAAPAWLEPRGLNVVDLVGLVPEAHLQNAIIGYEMGIIQYVSGQRNGNTVTIRTQVYPYVFDNGVRTLLNCLGQAGYFDHWGTVVPASEVRIYAGNQDVTNKVNFVQIWTAGQGHPVRNAAASPPFRYPENGVAPSFANGALQLPANSGCRIFLAGSYTSLIIDFTFQTNSPIQVTHLGSQTFNFRSYIGPGGAGRLDSLRNQMQARWPGIRHDKFTLQVPAGADYALVTFPPTPVTVYPSGDANTNFGQPSGGTYRLSRPVNNVLSIDHTYAMGLPIRGQWQDADQAPGTPYLPYFSDANILASPEYFLPPGVPYDPCMTNGGCSSTVLDQVYNATAPMTIHYYKVERTQAGLTRIPLQQVGPAWAPGAQRLAAAKMPAPAIGSEEKIFLPFVSSYVPPAPPEPDDPTGCPCGWFDDLGRMFDFIPLQ